MIKVDLAIKKSFLYFCISAKVPYLTWANTLKVGEDEEEKGNDEEKEKEPKCKDLSLDLKQTSPCLIKSKVPLTKWKWRTYTFPFSVALQLIVEPSLRRTLNTTKPPWNSRGVRIRTYQPSGHNGDSDGVDDHAEHCGVDVGDDHEEGRSCCCWWRWIQRCHTLRWYRELWAALICNILFEYLFIWKHVSINRHCPSKDTVSINRHCLQPQNMFQDRDVSFCSKKGIVYWRGWGRWNLNILNILNICVILWNLWQYDNICSFRFTFISQLTSPQSQNALTLISQGSFP